MQRMFHSATVKLTAWYLLLIMTIGLIFSLLIYQVTTAELQNRLSTFTNRIGPPQMTERVLRSYDAIREDQARAAKSSIIASLVYINFAILACGGIASYLLARRTLRPIQEAHEAQSRFTSDASHELRTPLAAMKAELEVALRDKHLEKAEMRELLESNLEEVNKLTELSQTLLRLSRNEHNDIPHATLHIKTLTEEVVQKYHKYSNRLHLHAAQAISSTAIQGNSASVEELLTILIDNALKYSPDDSPIHIHLEKKGKFIRIAVSNQGAGIAPDDLPHIFDRFYRADNARSGEGNGLGLSLAKSIVSLHNGELSVTSGPSSTTTFTVLLPILSKSKAKNQT